MKFTLEQATKAQRGSRGIAPLINIGARWGWVVNDTLRQQGRFGRVRKISPPPPQLDTITGQSSP
jgi:hypothetical protein